MQRTLFLSCLLATVSSGALAFPMEIRDDAAPTVDLLQMVESSISKIDPVVVPLATTNDTVLFDFNDPSEQEAAAAFVASLHSDDSSVSKRDACGAALPNPAAPLTAPLNLVTMSDFTSSAALKGSA